MTDWPIGGQTAQAGWSFDTLANDVLSLDAAIEWIALEQAGREMRWGWRDTSSGRVRTAVASADLPAVDPLLLLIAEGGDRPAGTIGRSTALLFVLVAYGDITQIVARWGADAYVSVAVGIAVDAHALGRQLMNLLPPRAHATMVH
jgi:hypothetical protein